LPFPALPALAAGFSALGASFLTSALAAGLAAFFSTTFLA